MKTFLLTLLLLGACFGAGAQGTNDPFFNTGHARSMNTGILGGEQAMPSLVSNAVTDLRYGDDYKAQLVSYLKNHYGYVVWDRGIAFTAHGNPTALIPMVFSEGTSISGVLIVVQQSGGLHYGVMDLFHPFPFVSNAANVEGLPGVGSILATFAYFNHHLFGHANCVIIQALHALAPHNARSAPEDQPKSCYYNIQAVTNCWHIYGQMPDGSQIHLYTECTTTHNWILTCLTPGGGFNFDAPPTGGVLTGNPGGSPGGTEITDLEDCDEGGEDFCYYQFERQISNSWANACYLTVRVSGCNFETCNVFVQPQGFIGCGFNLGSFSREGFNIPINYQVEVRNVRCETNLTQATSYEPPCNVSRRCGSLDIEYDIYLVALNGVIYGMERNTKHKLNEICYLCRNCQ